MASRAPRNLLVIGRAAYVDGLFPDDRTQLFDTSGFDNVRAPHLPGLKALGEAIGGNQFDLILCEANHRPPWSMNALSRLLFSRKTLQGRASLMPNFGQQLLRRRTSIPIGVIDHEDRPTIEAADLYLLSRCRFYFKREMPTDSWKLFMNTAAVGLPSLRFRAAARHRAWHDKLRPVSLGVDRERCRDLLRLRPAKTADIFFAGAVEGYPVREAGLAELLALRERGVKVDIPQNRLPRDEFYARCAAARLVWSPEGLGWDCFRHYEAALCGSVPVINYPSILRYRPQEDGIHCLFYPPEPGGLTEVVLRSLANPERLAALADQAARHAATYHARDAIGRYIVDTCLGDPASTGTSDAAS